MLIEITLAGDTNHFAGFTASDADYFIGPEAVGTTIVGKGTVDNQSGMSVSPGGRP